MAIFSYLSEFWDTITDVIIGGTTYTIEWFQQIGNAVAGAIGNIIIMPLQIVVDLGLIIGYIATSIINLISGILAPIRYIFTYLKEIIIKLNETPTTQTINLPIEPLTQNTYWSTLVVIIFGGIAILGLIKLFKSIKL